MTCIDVTLFPISNISHLRQVFTGFHALRRAGLLRIKYDADGVRRLGIKPGRDLDREAYCLGAEVAGAGLVIYDVHDSDVVNGALLDQCATYFKRSYNPAAHAATAKIQPLGLNLLVEDQPSLQAAFRAFRFGRGRTKYGDVLRALGVSPPYTARERDLAAFPVATPDPKVLFLTRVWQPEGYYGVTPDETRDRVSLNDMRADCVRQLRQAFGPRFVGGLLPDAFSTAHYPDAVFQGGDATRKDRYLASLDGFDVCVATRGLLGSTGWKFAEYLAKGRAIVSEPMAYAATGPLQAGRNYLEFRSAGECVEAVRALFDDRERRQVMMTANRAYFDGYVRPEALVLNSISRALAHA